MLVRILIVLIFNLNFAYAQSTGSRAKNIGRLSDGRAFRIDESGMRLVDQVAELEVNNDDLKRQVVALEDELNEKNGIIESLRAGIKVAPEDKLREQDLLGNTSSGLPKAATVKEANIIKEVVITKEASCDNKSENQEIQQLKMKLEELNRNADPGCRQEFANYKVQSEQEIVRNKDQIALLVAEKKQILSQLKAPDSEKNNLISRLGKLEQEKNDLLTQNNELLSQNTKLKNNINEKERLADQNQDSQSQEINRLKEQLAQYDQKSEETKQELALLKDQLYETQKEAIKLKDESRSRIVAPVEVRQQENPKPQKSPEAKNLLATIQAKIMKRKSLLDHVSKSGKGISLSASNLVTSSGLSLDRLRQAVNSDSSDELVLKGLREIDQILESDIATASRLAK